LTIPRPPGRRGVRCMGRRRRCQRHPGAPSLHDQAEAGPPGRPGRVPRALEQRTDRGTRHQAEAAEAQHVRPR